MHLCMLQSFPLIACVLSITARFYLLNLSVGATDGPLGHLRSRNSICDLADDQLLVCRLILGVL